MTTWSGWAADFLAAASLPGTANNRKFLTQWAANADHPSCGNNPIDLTHGEPNSTNCATTGRVGVHVQNYTSHTWARTAFNSEIHSGDYPHVLAALKSGNPYAVTHRTLMVNEIGEWGSTTFANVFLNETGSGPSVSGVAPQALKAYHDLQHAVNKKLPAALNHSQRMTSAALRALARAHKVRI